MTKALHSAAFSPDGQRVVTTSWDKTARLWDAATGKAMGEPMQHDEGVTFSGVQSGRPTGGNHLRDRTARLWDAYNRGSDRPADEA